MNGSDLRMPWLGTLPTGWTVERARFLFRQEAREPAEYDGVVTAFRDGQVTLRENRRTDGFMLALKETGYQAVRQGDLVIHSMDAFAGAIGVSESNGKCTGEYAVCNPVGKGFDNRYYAHVLREMARQGYIYVICPSVRERAPRFRYARFKDVHLPVPPPVEQKAIAAFLDRKTMAIDALIEKKQKLLDLLAEKRAALINQAVTKGLDPDVPMKDSGIPWIGEIPAHWEVKRLKHISARQTVGVVVNPSSYVDDAGEVPFIYGSEVSEGRIDTKNARRITHESNRKLSKSQLRAGDLVCVRVGDPGVTSVVPPELDGMNCGSIMIVRQAATCDSHWLCHAMNSKAGRQNVWLVAYGAAQKQYNIGHAVNFMYPIPPLAEQRRIASWLGSSTTKFAQSIRQLESSVERLQEYRQALITSAVTGQLDITEETA